MRKTFFNTALIIFINLGDETAALANELDNLDLESCQWDFENT